MLMVSSLPLQVRLLWPDGMEKRLIKASSKECLFQAVKCPRARKPVVPVKILVRDFKNHTELDLENVPSNPSSATPLQGKNAAAQDVMEFDGCAKTNPTLPGGDQTGILYETSTTSDKGYLVVPESQDNMMATDVNWPGTTGLVERELKNG